MQEKGDGAEEGEDGGEVEEEDEDVKDRAAVAECVRSKDFGRLVEMVLSGRGDAIRDWSAAATSDADAVDEEVQEFVDNVPAFQA